MYPRDDLLAKETFIKPPVSSQYMIWIILGVVLLVSLISLIGLFTFSLSHSMLDKLLFFFVSFAAGSMLAAAFLDLIPESLAAATSEVVFGSVLLGILVSFAIEKFIYHYHCHHNHKCAHHHHEKLQPYAYLNLIGDGFHNFLDGVIIAAGFVTGYEAGIIASIAVIAHEIPQEIGDFAVLLKSGLTRAKALLFNFLSALTAFVGALTGYYFSTTVQGIAPIFAAFASGMFIYIAATDLIPELHHEEKPGRSTIQFLMMFLGVIVIWGIKKYFEG